MKLLYGLLVITTLKSNAQSDLFYKGSAISHIKTAEGVTAISQKPVTNREYIIYLMWLKTVFSESYPDLFYQSIPGLAMDSLKMYEKKFPKKNLGIKPLLTYCKPFVSEYMFNPYYLDYPVVGVSWQNANNYAKWLSDRFNEVTLIKKHVLDYCPFPSDQDYFNTEAYIAGIWKGKIRLKLPSHDYNPIRKKDFNWSDHVFIPAFRLPSRLEVMKSYEAGKDTEEFKAYHFSKKNQKIVIPLIKKIMLRILIPIVLFIVFTGWLLYNLLIKKDLKKHMNTVYLASFFFGIWAIIYVMMWRA